MSVSSSAPPALFSPALPSALRPRMLAVLIMQCVVVLACVGVTTGLAIAVQERSIREATVERVLDVSRSLAGLDQVVAALQLPRVEATRELQPLADIVAQSSGVDYVVITDDTGIRLTHPTPSERGERVSTDASRVLAGETFVGTETGTIGPSLRAKVPIRDAGRVIGTASVGILESRIADDFTAAIGALVPWVIGSVIAGCLVSAALTALLRRRVRRLEREARELQAERRVSEALRDQTHEFHTRLHVVHGLVAEGQDAAALAYIADLAPVTTAVDRGDVDDPRVHAILNATAAALASTGGELVVGERSAVAPAVLDDDDLIVLSNLCRNAADAARRRVRVDVRADATGFHVSVADDGDGIAPRDVERIFQRGVSSKGEARGVGLDLVRRTVRRRGGTIEVGDSPWGGAQFRVEMPLAPVGSSS